MDERKKEVSPETKFTLGVLTALGCSLIGLQIGDCMCKRLYSSIPYSSYQTFSHEDNYQLNER